MRKSYLLLLFFIVEIYTALPKTCGTEATPAACTDCSSEPTQKHLDNGKCYTEVENCETYNPGYDACYKCSGQKVFSEGYKCVTKIANCKIHNDDGTTCTTCNPGYDKANDDKECECKSPKVTKGDLCVTNVQNCAKYKSDASGCEKCNNDFKLDASEDTCDECDDDTPKSFGGDTCFETIDGCTTYDDRTGGTLGNCLKCSGTNGYLQDGSCVKCDQTGEVRDKNYCHASAATVEKNCEEYDNTGKCVKCGNYMKLDNDKCVDIPCYYPQETNGVFCYTPVEHCSEYDDTDSEHECIKCASGYELTDDKTCVAKCSSTPSSPGGGANTNTNTNPTPSNNPDGSDGNMMRLNIIYMAIMLMIIV